MKKLFPYIAIIGFIVYSMWAAFTWDIPVDNQMGMFFFSCMGIGMFFIILFEDIRNYFKKKKPQPQRF